MVIDCASDFIHILKYGCPACLYPIKTCEIHAAGPFDCLRLKLHPIYVQEESEHAEFITYQFWHPMKP